MTVKELAEANGFKSTEANAIMKMLENLGIATNTGSRKDAYKGKGKRPSEFSLASTCTLKISDDGVLTASVPENEVIQEAITSTPSVEESVETEEVQ